MKKTEAKILVFLFVLLFLFGAQGFATNYYVDSVSGSDSNSGTSTGSPWKTLSKVNSVTYSGGDQILFKCGGYWTGQLTPSGSGYSGNPIVISQYDSGSDPIIDGNAASYTIRLNNVEYWEINNIEIMNTASTDALRIGLYVTATDAGTLDHIYIQNVYFHDIVSKAPNYAPGSHESAGSFTGAIVGRIFGSSTPTRFNDFRVEDCTFEDCDRNMFYFFDSPWYNDSSLGMSGGAGAMYNSTNVVVKNNYAVDIPGTGTCLCSCDGAILEYNTLDNCQFNVPSGVAGVACSTWSSKSCIYQYNEVMNTHGTADGQSFDNDGACRDCIFQYNYSHDNNGGFFLVCSLSSCRVYDGICRYNISQDDRSAIFDHRAASYNTQIYNNTIFTRSGLYITMFRTDTDSRSGTATFSNNIFVNEGGNINGPYGSFTWRYNVFYGNYSSIPSGTGNSTSDPQLVDAGSGGNGRNTVDGYMLYDTSPAIGSGILISGNGGKDYWGNSVSSSSSPNRGAYNGSGISQGSPTPTPPPTPTPAPTSTLELDLSYDFNGDGFSYDSNRSDGDFDDQGYSYSADLTTTSGTHESIPYSLGSLSAGNDNMVKCQGQSISIPQNQYTQMRLLGAASNGNQSISLTVNYTDYSTTNANFTWGDWCTGTGQNIVQSMAHRHTSSGDSSQTTYIFAYDITLNDAKTASSLSLPNNSDAKIFAITLISTGGSPTTAPPTTAPPTTPPPTTAPPTTAPPGGVLDFEDFESGWGDWTNVTGDQSDWIRNSGTTPSSSTGPSGDHTTGSGYYVYMETSSGYAYDSGDQVFLESQNFNATDNNITMSFYYHMYGSNMGTLNVDVYDGSWDLGVWSISGQQHTSSSAAYTQANVNLSSYSGTIKIRFRGVAAGSYRGDMAIDDIEVRGDGGDPTPTPSPTPTPPPGSYSLISQSGFSVVYVDSEETSGEDGAGENIIDGNTSTIWHTEWQSSNPSHPHEIQIDLGATYDVGGIRYLPRSESHLNGTIAQFEIYVSTSTSSWGTAVASGTWAANNNEKEELFTVKEGRYVRLRALSEVNSNPWTSGAEFNVLEYN